MGNKVFGVGNCFVARLCRATKQFPINNMIAIFLNPLILCALRARKIRGFRKMAKVLIKSNICVPGRILAFFFYIPDEALILGNPHEVLGAGAGGLINPGLPLANRLLAYP